jgi:chromate transporter
VSGPPPERVPLRTVLREWGRIGSVGFGGPPAHVALLRELVVVRRRWLGAREFEDAFAACNLLPGPASTQLAIYCAHRVAGARGALAGGLAFILPGLVAVLAIAAVALADEPPEWVRGVGAGAAAAVVAVIVQAGIALGRASLEGRRPDPGASPDRAPAPDAGGSALSGAFPDRAPAPDAGGSALSGAFPDRAPAPDAGGSALLRAVAYMLAGALAAIFAGMAVVVVLLAAGLAELAWRRRAAAAVHAWPLALALAAAGASELPALAWTALKVGALSYGGGFVIIPLMQGDAVEQGWMTAAEFANAVAYGQVTPGPVTHTVAFVGWAAAGPAGALLASAIAFAPSFAVIALAGERFERLRQSAAARAFLDGAGPAAVGAILGAAVTLAATLDTWWQPAVLAVAAAALALRASPILVLLGGALAGLAAALAGLAVPG